MRRNCGIRFPGIRGRERMGRLFRRYTKVRTGIYTYTVIEYISIFGLKILISFKDNVFFPPEHINCRCCNNEKDL